MNNCNFTFRVWYSHPTKYTRELPYHVLRRTTNIPCLSYRDFMSICSSQFHCSRLSVWNRQTARIDKDPSLAKNGGMGNGREKNGGRKSTYQLLGKVKERTQGLRKYKAAFRRYHRSMGHHKVMSCMGISPKFSYFSISLLMYY